MSGKKVYDLAKEFGVQSKEFAGMLQEINIPVKNHMSVITEQQEKYFRNNFEVQGNKIVPKNTTAKAETANTPKPQPKPQQARPAQDRPRQDGQRAQGGNPNYRGAQNNQGGNPNYRGGQNNQGSNPNYRGNQSNQSGNPNYRGNNGPRQGGAQGGYRGDNPRPYGGNRPQGDGNRPQGNSNYRGAQNNQGVSPNYKGNNPRPNYRSDGARPYNNNNNRPQGDGNRPPYNNQNSNYRGGGGGQQRPYQPRDGQRSGGWDKDRDNGRPQGAGGNRPQSRKPAVGEKPMEKSSKIDKSKKDNKQKNEQRSKARENFFNDKPARGIDNTKRVKGSKSSYKRKKLEAREERLTSGVTDTVILPEAITVAELGEKILIAPTEIIKILMSYGIMASMNQTIDFETASIICEELNIDVKLEEEEDIFESILTKHYADPDKLQTRPPIITVMGHVDHGKTSLLDAIRNTNVISGEAGGITQHIGAYTITTHDKSITFIDTPGHEAFTAMRSRGASVTDIAVLVIAADDGIKPQTVEAINHAKAAEVPIVVAINKIDKPAANPDKVKQELTEYGLVSEDWGGDTICVPVSAKAGTGIDDLLDTILLVAEVEELKANFEESAIGTIIEARIDKQRGVTASLLVKSGTLHDGDIIVSGTISGKVRAMTNDKGQRISEAGPSRAVEIIGLNEVPSAGDKFIVVENEKEARKITERRQDRIRLLAMRSNAPVTLDELFEHISQGEMKEVKLIVKADVQGSFEALKQSLEKLNNNDDGIRVHVIHGGVGAVTESDVTLAAASNALLIAFNVRPDNNARLAAAREEVEIRTYTVIYSVLEEIEAAMKGMLDPEFKEVVTGTAEVRQVFKVPNVGMVGGCYVTDGTITRKDKVRVIRDGIVIFDGEIASLKRFKDDVKEVASGYECGVGVEKYNDLKELDTLEFYKMEEVPRE